MDIKMASCTFCGAGDSPFEEDEGIPTLDIKWTDVFDHLIYGNQIVISDCYICLECAKQIFASAKRVMLADGDSVKFDESDIKSREPLMKYETEGD